MRRLPLRSPVGAARSRRLASRALVAGTVLAAAGAASAGLDWVDVIDGSSHNVLVYYGGAASVLTGGQSLEAYQDNFDYRVPEDTAVSAWIGAHGLDGSSAVVWSADAWLYDDNQLQLVLPTPPIYNDESLLGNHGPVARRGRRVGSGGGDHRGLVQEVVPRDQRGAGRRLPGGRPIWHRDRLGAGRDGRRRDGIARRLTPGGEGTKLSEAGGAALPTGSL